MPNLTLAHLDSALSKLHGLSVYSVSHDDLTSLGRYATNFEEWEVCTQKPSAGTPIKKDTKVALGVGMIGEQCTEPSPSPSEPLEPEAAPAEPIQEPQAPELYPVTEISEPELSEPQPAPDVYYKNCTAACAAGARPSC